jgi:type I restriction enzyme R subunit
MKPTQEAAFGSVIELDLLAKGYVAVDKAGFDRERAVFPKVTLAFMGETQAKEWGRLEALHDAETGELVLADLCKWMDAHGCLATLRHGFKCYGRTLRVAFFKAVHGLNSELEARYKANRVGITRQLHYSARDSNSLNVTINLNGIPQSGESATDLRGRFLPSVFRAGFVGTVLTAGQEEGII